MMNEVKRETQAGTTSNVVEKIQPQTLPSAYAALGVERGYKPLPVDDLRLFIVGPSGEGKSTFASGSARTIILDFERGAQGVIKGRAFRLHIKDKTVLDKIVKQLVDDSKNPGRPFDRVAFDTIDEMAELMNPVLAAQLRKDTKFTGTDITDYGTKGAGWAILKHGCWEILKTLETAGYTWTVVGHITEKTITVNKQDRTVPRPVLFDSFARLIGRNCDVFAAIYSEIGQEKTYIVHQGRRVQGPNREIVQIYMDATTLNSEKNTGQGKCRGVPTMTTKILLPNPLTDKYGWDTFADMYNTATQKVQDALKGE